ncbi:MAG: lysylphosphatidylglycerol synthase transmembrane domain-containing protein, partial [Armatimonadota bacterium]
MTEETIAEPKPQREPLWKLALKIVISAVLIYVITRMLDFRELGLVFGRANWLLVALGFLLFLLAQILRTIRWHLLIVCQKPGVPFWATLNAMFVGLFLNLVLPAELGGDVVRGLWLDKVVGSR